MTKQELIEKRAKAWKACQDMLDSKRRDDGTLSVDDSAAYDKMEADIESLTKEIDRLTRLENIGASLREPTSSPIVSTPGADTDVNSKRGKAYAKAMIDGMRVGFKSVSNLLQEQVAADGGYLVPDEWDSRLIQKLQDENIMRKLATTIKTSGDHRINIVNTDPAAAWISEGASITFDDQTKFGQAVLDAYKLAVGIKVTDELLYDNAYDLEGYITDSFGRAIANAEENAFIIGDGTGKPTGVFNTGETIECAEATFKADDIYSLIYSLRRPYRKNAQFIMNDTIIAMVRKFKDANGAYLWQPSYKDGEPDRLAGYPLNTSVYAPTTGMLMAFGDFSYYNIADRGDRSMKILDQPFAASGQVGFKMTERVDGKLILPEAVKVLKTKTASGS